MARLHSLMEHAGRYLTVSEGDEILRTSRLLVKRYLELVRDAVRRWAFELKFETGCYPKFY